MEIPPTPISKEQDPEAPKPATLPEAPLELPETPPTPPTTPEAPALPPAAEEVLKGKETEQTSDLARKLEAQAAELKKREMALAQKESDLQRRSQPPATRQKKAWLGGNSIFD